MGSYPSHLGKNKEELNTKDVDEVKRKMLLSHCSFWATI